MGTVATRALPKKLNAAEASPNFTEVAPARLLPVIWTDVPGDPSAGEKALITGGSPWRTVKDSVVVKVPPDVVTLMGPVVAACGMVAKMIPLKRV